MGWLPQGTGMENVTLCGLSHSLGGHREETWPQGGDSFLPCPPPSTLSVQHPFFSPSKGHLSLCGRERPASSEHTLGFDVQISQLGQASSSPSSLAPLPQGPSSISPPTPFPLYLCCLLRAPPSPLLSASAQLCPCLSSGPRTSTSAWPLDLNGGSPACSGLVVSCPQGLPLALAQDHWTPARA